MSSVDWNELIKGDRRSLAKAITLIESKKNNDHLEARRLVTKALQSPKNAKRIGISGSPGVGKSTFIEEFGLFLISKGHKLAVLAIDPSSPISGGSIMGDKTRMAELSQAENAFIRPSPSGLHLGGVHTNTQEAILLCEQAGFDFIIVETVGVGQSEYEVASMVDWMIFLAQPGSGDELQGIKKGILETCDLLIVTKADGDLLNEATKLESELRSAFDLSDLKKIEILLCSSILKTGFDAIYEEIKKLYSTKVTKLSEKKAKQELNWFEKKFHQELMQRISESPQVNNLKKTIRKQIASKQKFPHEAAAELCDIVLKKLS